MRSLCRNGSPHHEYQDREHDANHCKDQECIKIRKCRSLLLTQIIEGSESHLLRGSGIAGLLKVERLRIREVGIHGRIQIVELLSEPQEVELFTPFRNRLPHRCPDAPPFVPQQRQHTNCGTSQRARNVEIGCDVHWREDESKSADHHDPSPNDLPWSNLE